MAIGNAWAWPALGVLEEPTRSGVADGVVSFSTCGQDGPMLTVPLQGLAIDTVLVYVERSPAGVPDSMQTFRKGQRTLHLSSGSQLCGSASLDPGDLASGKTLWLVPVNQAGRRGAPVKVVVPT